MKTKKIIITGGGTAGSVSPLLSVVDKIRDKDPNIDFLFIGTRKGDPEKRLAKTKNIPYKSIFSGKLRRYFSFKNIIDPFKIIIGFFQSLVLVKKHKPDAVIGAGSFVGVPICIAAWFFKVPVFLHQLDTVPGLANKIISAFATKITLSFDSLKDNFPKKSIVTGTPVRYEILKGNKNIALEDFNLRKDLETILIMGGGTGSKRLNEIVLKSLDGLTKNAQVIHITGKGKLLKARDYRYRSYEFLIKSLKHAYDLADLIISRAGVGSLSEFCLLSKPVIFIPLPNSSQVKNAYTLCKQDAAICLEEKDLTLFC